MTLLMVTCSVPDKPHELTPDEIVLIDSLQSTMKTLQEDIDAALVESAQYDGGLLKNLIDARVATLRLSKDVLEQRVFAIKSNVPIMMTISTPAPDSLLLVQLETEMETLDTEIIRAQLEADKYTGGLLQVLALSTVATTQQSKAMLRFRYLAAKYGFDVSQVNMYQESTSGIQERAISTPEESTASPEPKQSEIEITDLDAKVTETNQVWSKYSWKITVNNLGDTGKTLDAKMEFLDADGFIIDDDTERNQYIPANSEKVITGYALIDADVAANVEKLNASVKSSY